MSALCGECYSEPARVVGFTWESEPYTLGVECAEYYGVAGGNCQVCGEYTSATVCQGCESAKGNWEDTRLDDYGRLIKR